MLASTDWYYILVFFISILGLLVACLLYFVNKDESFSARVLSIFLFCISVVLLTNTLGQTSFYFIHPHFYRTPAIFTLCAPVFGYLYLRTVIEREFRFRRTDIIFFIPAIIVLINFIPFYLWPASKKIALLQQQVADETMAAREPEGILPDGWAMSLRLVVGFALAVAQYVLLARNRKKIMQAPGVGMRNIEMFRWLFFFTLVLSSTYFLLIFEMIFHTSRFYNYRKMVTFTIAANVIFTCVYLLFNPKILYGFTGWLHREEIPLETSQETNSLIPEKRRSYLTDSQATAYKTAFETYLNERKPFVKPGYKKDELADELDIPPYLLSAFINQEYGKNFNELINEYRIVHLAELLQQNPDISQQFTFEALSRQVGFNSRNAFIAAVKKQTGKTPSVFFVTRENA